jgi:prepilin-type N-terminal cleavage/methylation domain-containing protein
VVNKKTTNQQQPTMQQNNEYYEHDRPAFTLLELLAVVAILGVLAAIVIPVIGGAKSAAQDAKCKVNLRQLHSGWMAYGAETGLMPIRWNPGGNQTDQYGNGDPDPRTGDVRWQINLRSYLGVVGGNDGSTLQRLWANQGPLVCPADRRKTLPVNTEEEYIRITGIGHLNGVDNPSYGSNHFLEYLNRAKYSRGTRFIEVNKNPVLLMDSAYRMVTASAGGVVDSIRYRHGADVDYDIEKDKGSSKFFGGHANAVFWDGRVHSFKENTIPTATMLGNDPPIRSSCQDHPKSHIHGYDFWVPWYTD